MKELLARLTEMDGVPGFEDEIRDFVVSEAQKHVQSVTVDCVGNVLCFKKGEKAPSSPILLTAHMDEVGFLIKDITKDGMLKVAPAGSIDPRVLIGRRLRVGKNKIPGIISIKAIHLTTPEERKKAPELKSLYIDIGALDREDAEKLVSIGDPAVFDTAFASLGVDCIKAKALDDRVGCAILLKLMEEDIPFDTYFLFSASEEIGCRGAINAVSTIDPGFICVVEGTPAGDVPDTPEHLYSTRLREGAAISLIDGSTIYSRALRDKIIARLDREKIRHQFKLRQTGGNDGAAMIYGTGAKVFGLSVPMRYIHAANSVAYLPDVEDTLSTARVFLEEAASENE